MSDTLRRDAWRVLLVSLVAAAVAGMAYGMEFTLRDPAWPERGGAKGLAQSCAIFFGYSLPVALLAGLLLRLTLGPAMARAGAFLHGLTGAAAGVLTQALLFKAIGEPLVFPNGLVAGALAGAVAGLAWRVTDRRG